MANNRKHQNRAQKGYIASLTPEGQVNKVMTDIKNLKGGHDLRNWSGSARKELKFAPSVSLQVGKDVNTTVKVPKLALVVASPVARQYFEQKPAATTAKFVHPDIKLRAVRSIAQWLEKVTNEQYFPELAMPKNFGEMFDLRLTAYTLGMEHYVEHFEWEYMEDVDDRVPTVFELITAVNCAREEDDPIVAGLAHHVADLRRFHKISAEEEAGYADLLANTKYQCLLDTFYLKKACTMAHGGNN